MRRPNCKHSALLDFDHDVHFQPPAPDGNAYTHLYWLAAKDTNYADGTQRKEEGRQVHLGFMHSLMLRPS
jgi:hypothetical protein